MLFNAVLPTQRLLSPMLPIRTWLTLPAKPTESCLPKLPATIRPPTVVLLNVSREEDVITQFYQLGANSFILNPIGPPEWLTDFETIHRC